MPMDHYNYISIVCLFHITDMLVIQTSYGFWQVPEKHRKEYQIGKLPLWIHWGRYFDFLHPEDAVHVQQHSNEQDLAYFGTLDWHHYLIIALGFPIFEKQGAFKAGIHYSLQNDDKLPDPTLERNYSVNFNYYLLIKFRCQIER
jgi:hypothetical protein